MSTARAPRNRIKPSRFPASGPPLPVLYTGLERNFSNNPCVHDAKALRRPFRKGTGGILRNGQGHGLCSRRPTSTQSTILQRSVRGPDSGRARVALAPNTVELMVQGGLVQDLVFTEVESCIHLCGLAHVASEFPTELPTHRLTCVWGKGGRLKYRKSRGEHMRKGWP